MWMGEIDLAAARETPHVLPVQNQSVRDPMTVIEDILRALEGASDPVAELRARVLQENGLWFDPEEVRGIVEIQLAGLVGVGPSVVSAVDDWVEQAKAMCAREALQAG